MNARNSIVAALLVTAGLGATGCATKKYVRQQIDPVTGRVVNVEKASADNAKEIEQVGSSASRANERATSAENLAKDAGSRADQANQAAGQAGQKADQATQAANQSLAKANDLAGKFDNLDNYKPVQGTSVLFRTNSAALRADAKQQLDQLAQQVTAMKRYVIEVKGFTDRTGNRDANVALSEKRADAVVRYLTGEKGVPLRNVRVIGYGVDPEMSKQRGRAALKQARHVELKVYAPDLGGSSTQATASANPSSGS